METDNTLKNQDSKINQLFDVKADVSMVSKKVTDLRSDTMLEIDDLNKVLFLFLNMRKYMEVLRNKENILGLNILS